MVTIGSVINRYLLIVPLFVLCVILVAFEGEING